MTSAEGNPFCRCDICLHPSISPHKFLARHPSIASLSTLYANMPWPFCPSCRATLRVDGSGAIDCQVCGYSSNLDRMETPPSSTTYSAERPIPLWARSAAEQAAMQRSKEPVRATVEEPCIKCGHEEVGYYTVQLRSVDEGQTVFYECPSCKYTWSINN